MKAKWSIQMIRLVSKRTYLFFRHRDKAWGKLNYKRYTHQSAGHLTANDDKSSENDDKEAGWTKSIGRLGAIEV